MEVDLDNDDALDLKEFYIALLRLYDRVNHTLPCHLKIPSTAQVIETFNRHDVDKSGRLSFDEFLAMAREMARGRNGRFRDSILFKALLVLSVKLVALPVASRIVRSTLHAGGLPGPPRAITQAAIQMGMEQGFKQFNLGIPL